MATQVLNLAKRSRVESQVSAHVATDVKPNELQEIVSVIDDLLNVLGVEVRLTADFDPGFCSDRITVSRTEIKED